MNYKLFSFKSGKHLNEVKNAFKLAEKEAKEIGITEKEYIEEIAKVILGLDEDNYKETIKNINNSIIKNGFNKISDFFNYLIKEDGVVSGGPTTVSTSFSPSVRPENLIKPKIKNNKNKKKNAK